MNIPPNGALPHAAHPTPRPPQARLAASRAAILHDLTARPATPPLLAAAASTHPWALLGGAALAGALVVAARPWRWLPHLLVLAPLLSPLARQALAAHRAQAQRQLSPPSGSPSPGDGRTRA